VVVVAGPVDREAPEVRGSAVAEPAQLQDGAVALTPVDVGEVGSEADLDAASDGQWARAWPFRRAVRLALVDGGGAFIGCHLGHPVSGRERCVVSGPGVDPLEHRREIASREPCDGDDGLDDVPGDRQSGQHQAAAA
jgi:hypothetical protein